MTKVNIGAELGCVCDSRKEEEPLIPVTIDQQSVEGVSSLKYLGRVVDLKLTFSSNIVQVYKKAQQCLYMLRECCSFRDGSHVLASIYIAVVLIAFCLSA